MLNDDARTWDRLDADVVKQYGESRLTAKLIADELLKGTVTPYSTPKKKLLGFSAVVLATVAVPWYWEPYADAGDSIAGMPGWAWLNFLAYLTTVAIQWYLVYTWETVEEGAQQYGAMDNAAFQNGQVPEDDDEADATDGHTQSSPVATAPPPDDSKSVAPTVAVASDSANLFRAPRESKIKVSKRKTITLEKEEGDAGESDSEL